MQPSIIGPYTLTTTLGEGAFGKVKLGTKADGTKVAVKIMKLENAEPDYIEKARVEA